MDRYQKKCLVASMLMHGLLLLVLVVGTAFFNSEKKLIDSPHIMTVINGVVTDGNSGGGAPVAASAPAPAPQNPTPKPEPPKPALPQPEPEREKPVDPPKPKPDRKEIVSELPVQKKQRKPLPEPVTKPTTPKPVKPTRNIDISKPTVRDNQEKRLAAEAAQRAAEKRAFAQKIAAFNGLKNNIENHLSKGTTIDLPPGLGGGPAEINYGDLVLSKYDLAWIAPNEVDDDVAIAKVRVVIARNGNVVSSEIIKASGNSILDKSVRRALDSVRFIERFPESSKDSQRTYIINFNLKTKRGLG